MLEISRLKKDLVGDILLLYIGIPVVLLAVYFSSLNDTLAFYLNEPTILTAYFSNFTHNDLNHLQGNLIFYFFGLTLAYALQRTTFVRTRKELYTDTALIFILVPFAVSGISLCMLNAPDIPFKGFSGIVAAMLGYSISLFVFFVYKLMNLETSRIRYTLNLFIIFNLVVMMIFRSYVGIATMILLTVLIIADLFLARQDLQSIIAGIENLSNTKKYFKQLVIFLFFLIVLINFIFWLVLFPNSIINDGSLTNIWGHYVGYVIGMYSVVINNAIFAIKRQSYL
jgi:hypothetical protein